MLPDADWGRICLDKYECYRHLKKHGFPLPWTDISLGRALKALNQGRIQFPLILKARMGFGSIGLNWCNNKEELKLFFNLIQKQVSEMKINKHVNCPIDEAVLVQQAVEGTEYCVDIINDLNGNYVNHLALEVHTMRAGETDFVTTADPSIAADIPQKLSRLTKHRGIWGIDVRFDKGKPLIIDINPRFTGDYPYHQISGANIPAAMLAWAAGEKPDPAWLKAEVGVKGYKELVPTIIH